MTAPEVKLFNTLTREKEVFVPLTPGQVKMYTCGPTVYNYAHIGNLRSYIFPDLLKKLLAFLGYQVTQIMNFTDVGHLTSDADAGDDKIEKAAAALGKSAWDISKFYAEAFIKDISALNIAHPSRFTYASDYIPQQIDLVKALEDKDLTYANDDGVYYDTAQFADYGKMAKLDVEGLQEGARIDADGKRNKTDFALWKFSPSDAQRQMEWESPWGKGFPGWHLECTAMIFAELGQTIDIHTGGTDHIPVHHTNEIAQAEGATGQPFVKYWLHGEFLVLDKNKRMGKSEGNFVTLKTLVAQGFEPLIYRYLCLTSHYRQFLSFSFENLESAKKALFHLHMSLYLAWDNLSEEKKHIISNPKLSKDDISTFFENAIEKNAFEYRNKIWDALCDDLNAPKAIGFIWDLIKNNEVDNFYKLLIIKEVDQILSLNLIDFHSNIQPSRSLPIPSKVIELADIRWEARLAKNWAESDRLRDLIRANGFEMRDLKEGYEIVPRDVSVQGTTVEAISDLFDH